MTLSTDDIVKNDLFSQIQGIGMIYFVLQFS